ncbi:MAG TPA: 4-hydroxythreonine-4-phosphate dehydrogenase PdxA [Planctomycetaceae bacterium]|nr:4-hydroxythreonine-4-phosphate dehydrogenase PdxA [Planctomycetaceae bacterium]
MTKSGSPNVAITLGDVAGIGPEVVARACADGRVRGSCRPLVVGHPQILRRAATLAGVRLAVRELDALDALSALEADPGQVACWNPAGDAALAVPPATVDPRAGDAAYRCLLAATQAALAGHVDAIVTAPISKAALHAAGHHYPGHTEILAELCGVQRYAMMLYLPTACEGQGTGPRPTSEESANTSSARVPVPCPSHGVSSSGLAVAHVTLHTSIASVPGLLTAAGVLEKIELTIAFLERIGCSSPRVGVSALNPHAGEEGLFGDEEPRIIRPAVESARAMYGEAAFVDGPIPADTLFRRALDGEFDGVVAMYHDQGHIALKLAGLGRAVNVTLGLPIVRTSPSHGTAFDIAWQGVARAEGIVDAIRLAVRLKA